MKSEFCRVVGLYEVDKGHGGPEEGGWWYDCGTLVKAVEPVVCHSQEEVRAALAAISAQVESNGMNAARHKPSSVLCTGWFEPRSFRGNTAPAYFPDRRPRYA